MPFLPENRVVQSLWIGASLSAMEQLGIASRIDPGADLEFGDETFAVHLRG